MLAFFALARSCDAVIPSEDRGSTASEDRGSAAIACTLGSILFLDRNWRVEKESGPAR